MRSRANRRRHSQSVRRRSPQQGAFIAQIVVELIIEFDAIDATMQAGLSPMATATQLTSGRTWRRRSRSLAS